jgi:starch synthase (maltosyl-transferring)
MIASLNDKNTTQASVKIPKDLLYKAPLKITDLITGNKYSWDKEWNFVELSPELPFHLFLIH